MTHLSCGDGGHSCEQHAGVASKVPLLLQHLLDMLLREAVLEEVLPCLTFPDVRGKLTKVPE
jgi:hypothetical protein